LAVIYNSDVSAEVFCGQNSAPFPAAIFIGAMVNQTNKAPEIYKYVSNLIYIINPSHQITRFDKMYSSSNPPVE